MQRKQIAGIARSKRRATIGRAAFAKYLGRSAFEVWDRLCKLRDNGNRCTSTVREIAGDRLAERNVRKGLARLRELALVESEPGASGTGRRVRVVHGVEREPGSVLVPPDVAAKLRDVRQWGGGRSGSGRKSSAHKKPSQTDEVERSPEVPNQVGPLTIQEGPFSDSVFSRGAVKVCATEHSATLPYGESERSGPYVVGASRARAGASDLDSDQRVRLQANERAADAAPDFSLRGGRSPGSWCFDGVPAMPTIANLKPVIVPAPPPLPLARSLGEQVEFVAATWEHAVAHRFSNGKACGTFRRRGGVLGSDYFDLLADSTGLFVEQEIAPAAWLAFSFDVWESYSEKPKRRNGKTRKPPPLKWVFERSRFEERSGWFRNALGSMTLGGQVIFVQSYRELMRRHAAMRFALLKLSAPTNAEVSLVVDCYFPNGLYSELVSKAETESAKLRERFALRAARGEWLW